MFYLKDKEVSLREFSIGDIDNKVEWINDERNNKYLHYDIPICKEKTMVWFKNKSKNRLDCVIEYNGIPVGLIGFASIDEVNQKAEYYISMGRHDFKQKGIATRATRLILKYAFNELNLNKVYLNVDEENTIACRMYEKIGFHIEGRFKKDLFHKGNFINRCRYAIFNENII